MPIDSTLAKRDRYYSRSRSPSTACSYGSQRLQDAASSHTRSGDTDVDDGDDALDMIVDQEGSGEIASKQLFRPPRLL